MPSPFRVAFVAALAIGCHDAFTQTAVPPQLTVQLVSVLPDGSAQIVSFTPAVALTPEQIAQTLQNAPITAPGTGSTPPTLEHATPIAPASTPTLRH
jgi:hypothetical protein